MSSDEQLQSLRELIDIMAQLRSENGCPWDRRQTPETLKKHILEEAYELIEAIDAGSSDDICDELGDLLLQVVFQAQIFSETGQFGITEVANSISAKLIRRHPHIFADASHEGHEQRWEEIKKQERAEKGESNSLAKRIPQTLPALKRGTKLAKKCTVAEPIQELGQMQEQLQRLQACFQAGDSHNSEIEKNLTQLLLRICNFSAAAGLDPEDLLRKKTTQLISEIDSRNNL